MQKNHCTIFTIEESPLDEDIIWVGTDDGNVQLTLDGGKNWTNVTANIPGLPKNTWAYHIEPSNFDKQTAYAVFDGHTQNDMNPYVYKTTDGGKSWTSIVSEDIYGFARSIQEDFVNPNLLYLGTEFGLYITVDGGQNWSKFTNNMPSVAVHHVTLHPRDHSLVLATHGRGVIIIDDITPLRQLTQEVIGETVHFFERPPAIIKESPSFGGTATYGEFVGENPSSAAQIVYYLKSRHTFGKMTMGIFDQDGNQVADLAPGKAKGINTVSWNYRRKIPKVAAAKTFAFGGLTAPTVPPGTYTVRITKAKKTYETQLTLVPDPESIHTKDDRAAQQEAAMKLYHMNEDLAYLIDQIDMLSEGTQAVLSANPSKKILKMVEPLAQKLTTMKESLVITTGDNYVGTAEPQLREKIASLYGEVAGFQGRPSQGQMQNMKLLSGKLKDALQQMESLLEGLPKINKALAAKDMPALSFRSKEEFMEADI